jgi:hypothetical protein
VRRTATSPGVRDALAAADGLLLEHLKATFGPELDALAPTDRHDSVAALDTASSWEAWERLRATSGLGVRPAKRVVARMLAAHCPTPAAAGRRRAAVATPVPGEGA